MKLIAEGNIILRKAKDFNDTFDKILNFVQDDNTFGVDSHNIDTNVSLLFVLVQRHGG